MTADYLVKTWLVVAGYSLVLAVSSVFAATSPVPSHQSLRLPHHLLPSHYRSVQCLVLGIIFTYLPIVPKLSSILIPFKN